MHDLQRDGTAQRSDTCQRLGAALRMCALVSPKSQLLLNHTMDIDTSLGGLYTACLSVNQEWRQRAGLDNAWQWWGSAWNGGTQHRVGAAFQEGVKLHSLGCHSGGICQAGQGEPSCNPARKTMSIVSRACKHLFDMATNLLSLSAR